MEFTNRPGILLLVTSTLLSGARAQAQPSHKLPLPSIVLGGGAGLANLDESSHLSGMVSASVRLLPAPFVGLEADASRISDSSGFYGGESSMGASVILRMPFERVVPFVSVGHAFHRERSRRGTYANDGMQVAVGVDVRVARTVSIYGQQVVIPTSNYIVRYTGGIRYAVYSR